MLVSDDNQASQIGPRIRAMRKRRGLTLKALAARTGLSVPYLSQIENSLVNLNLAKLVTIGQALGVPLATFFMAENASSVSIMRRAERRWYQMGDNASESLLVKLGGNLEIFTIRLSAGHSSIPDSTHQGEEFTYVLRGSVRILLGDEQVYELQEGDIIYYFSSIPHTWQNAGDDEAEILVVNTPATY